MRRVAAGRIWPDNINWLGQTGRSLCWFPWVQMCHELSNLYFDSVLTHALMLLLPQLHGLYFPVHAVSVSVAGTMGKSTNKRRTICWWQVYIWYLLMNTCSQFPILLYSTLHYKTCCFLKQLTAQGKLFFHKYFIHGARCSLKLDEIEYRSFKYKAFIFIAVCSEIASS